MANSVALAKPVIKNWPSPIRQNGTSIALWYCSKDSIKMCRSVSSCGGMVVDDYLGTYMVQGMPQSHTSHKLTPQPLKKLCIILATLNSPSTVLQNTIIIINSI